MIFRQSFPRGVKAEAPVSHAIQSRAVRSQPEVARRVFEQRSDQAALDFIGVGVVKNSEPNAVEARGTGLCSQPKVTVARSRNCLNGVLRQTMLFQPDKLLVSAQHFLGSERLARSK